MALSIRPSASRLTSLSRCSIAWRTQYRCVSAGTLRYRTPPRPLPPPPKYRTDEAMKIYQATYPQPHILPASARLKVYQPPGKSGKRLCPEPLKTWDAAQLKILDPTGVRTRLFAEENEDRARVGDVLMVRFRSGDPFAGVCMNIRRRGPDTGILLRNQVARVGTEMWVKIYSPTVVGIEVVDRRPKRARRARLYYLRKPKHDRGSLAGLIERYMKNKAATGRGVSKAKRKAPTPATGQSASKTP